MKQVLYFTSSKYSFKVEKHEHNKQETNKGSAKSIRSTTSLTLRVPPHFPLYSLKQFSWETEGKVCEAHLMTVTLIL